MLDAGGSNSPFFDTEWLATVGENLCRTWEGKRPVSIEACGGKFNSRASEENLRAKNSALKPSRFLCDGLKVRRKPSPLARRFFPVGVICCCCDSNSRSTVYETIHHPEDPLTLKPGPLRPSGNCSRGALAKKRMPLSGIVVRNSAASIYIHMPGHVVGV
jgi:hypothetical protein